MRSEATGQTETIPQVAPGSYIMSTPNLKHQFKHSYVERRASTVYGSVGKQGLFLPSDFFGSKDASRVNSCDDIDRQPLLTPISPNAGPNRRKSSIAQDIIDQERELLKTSHIDVRDGSQENVAAIFEDAIVSKRLKRTTPKAELQSLMKSSFPLVITFLLENSLSTVSVFTVGHLGAVELAAVSMGSMTANITGYATIQGISTALDTLCPQAYGAKRYHLVGEYMQKCIVFTTILMLPILTIWIFFGYELITLMLPDKETAHLAARYLRYISFGIPAYIFFECGKRFLQAQGIFHVSTYVLLFAAPLNLIMNIAFVHAYGYVGAPIAVAINYWIMALGLFLCTYFFVDETHTLTGIHPLQCWSGLDLKKASEDWRQLISLAIPGLIMLEAEFLAFEILTLMASYLGTIELAAQSVGATIASLTYQVPFAIGIVSSSRIANYLGAEQAESARITSKVSLLFGLGVSFLNFFAIFLLKEPIAKLFSNDDRVISLLRQIMWLVALMQISDSMNANSAGCLRGQGQTKIGGIVNLISYYLIGIPVSIYLAFFSKWRGSLDGLWVGTTLALTIIGVVQSFFVLSADYNRLCSEASERTHGHSHIDNV